MAQGEYHYAQVRKDVNKKTKFFVDISAIKFKKRIVIYQQTVLKIQKHIGKNLIIYIY